MTEKMLLRIMNATVLIPDIRLRDKRRTIYETGEGSRLTPSGHFHFDYGAKEYGGPYEEVPKSLIDRLEREGKLVRAFPDKPELNGWVLP
jgi:hypothetical protein